MRGVTQMRGPDDGTLINDDGEVWRDFRMEQLKPAVGFSLLGVLAIVVLFRFLRGNIKMAGGRSGMVIQRFTNSQRAAHWTTAILFVILMVTGIVLLVGRTVLIPIFGPEGFGVVAQASKTIHDYLGPLFMFSMIWLFIVFVKGNAPSPKLDFQWVAKGGGIFGKHAHADRYNAGEKIWFWLAVFGGIFVIISGMILDFPIFGLDRASMKLAHIIHGISTGILMVVAIGHIYMGTAAMQGTFEVMKTGYCDANWAKEHHDLWYDKVKEEAVAANDLDVDHPSADRAPSQPTQTT